SVGDRGTGYLAPFRCYQGRAASPCRAPRLPRACPLSHQPFSRRARAARARSRLQRSRATQPRKEYVVRIALERRGRRVAPLPHALGLLEGVWPVARFGIRNRYIHGLHGRVEAAEEGPRRPPLVAPSC
ncbi:unnamed protein product, partial [Pelagomonas calceolata]